MTGEVVTPKVKSIVAQIVQEERIADRKRRLSGIKADADLRQPIQLRARLENRRRRIKTRNRKLNPNFFS